jgi:hypothetical protein
MTSQKHYTAGEITKWAIAELTSFGFHVWRANNIAIPGRKFIGMKGMPDIIGYDCGGVAVWCEVKTINDKLSKDQRKFLDRAMYAGCKCYIATQDKNGNVELKNWS